LSSRCRSFSSWGTRRGDLPLRHEGGKEGQRRESTSVRGTGKDGADRRRSQRNGTAGRAHNSSHNMGHCTANESYHHPRNIGPLRKTRPSGTDNPAMWCRQLLETRVLGTLSCRGSFSSNDAWQGTTFSPFAALQLTKLGVAPSSLCPFPGVFLGELFSYRYLTCQTDNQTMSISFYNLRKKCERTVDGETRC
jgi:hypothetical protein